MSFEKCVVFIANTLACVFLITKMFWIITCQSHFPLWEQKGQKVGKNKKRKKVTAQDRVLVGGIKSHFSCTQLHVMNATCLRPILGSVPLHFKLNFSWQDFWGHTVYVSEFLQPKPLNMKIQQYCILCRCHDSKPSLFYVPYDSGLTSVLRQAYF